MSLVLIYNVENYENKEIHSIHLMRRCVLTCDWYCMYVCPSIFLTTVHPIDFILCGCIAEDTRKCGVVWSCLDEWFWRKPQESSLHQTWVLCTGTALVDTECCLIKLHQPALPHVSVSVTYKSRSPVFAGLHMWVAVYDVLCPCAGSCIQWGGRLNQGRKGWSSSNPGDARGCLFFSKRPPLGKPRCGGSTCQRSPPHWWGFSSSYFSSLTNILHWQNASQHWEGSFQELQFELLILPFAYFRTVWLRQQSEVRY